MKFIDFSDRCDRLCGEDSGVRSKLDDLTVVHFLHGAVGAATEAGELLDLAKKAMVYGKPLDAATIADESGDVLHYLSYCWRPFLLTPEICMEANVAKLKVRFGEDFDPSRAVKKDKLAERTAVEEVLKRWRTR